MKFKELLDTQKPFKLITPDGYVGYYRGHTSGVFAVHIVWISMKPTSKRIYPIPIDTIYPDNNDINYWEVTETEECNIEELFKIKKL